MTKQNKVLEALETVMKRIETEVYHWKKADGEELYDAKGVNKILREEINKAIEEGEKKLKPKKMKDKPDSKPRFLGKNVDGY